MDCKFTESILAGFILVFTIWPALISSEKVGYWIVITSAIFILIHSQKCNSCSVFSSGKKKDTNVKKKLKKKSK